MDDQSCAEDHWWRLFVRDFGLTSPKTRNRPTPKSWKLHYIDNMRFHNDKGIDFKVKAVRIINEVTSEYQSELQRLALKGKPGCFLEAFRKAKESFPVEVIEKKNKSVLHYAVLSRSLPFLRAVCSAWGDALDLSQNDLITGFTPLHFAVFVQSEPMLRFLIEKEAEFTRKDNFFADAFDYARMLGMVPQCPRELVPPSLCLYRSETKRISWVTIEEWESMMGVQYMPFVVCQNQYILELMFSGFALSTLDETFREKYQEMVWGVDPFRYPGAALSDLEEVLNDGRIATGDKNLIFAHINSTVGYGCFAAKDFEEGEFIVRYGGCLTAEDEVKNREYAVMCGAEGVVLDARVQRNMGALVNHSSFPNARLECFFDRGAEQAMIIAAKHITRGEQVMLDYAETFSSAAENTCDVSGDEGEEQDMFFAESTFDTSGFLEMSRLCSPGDPGGFPLRLPSHVFCTEK